MGYFSIAGKCLEKQEGFTIIRALFVRAVSEVSHMASVIWRVAPENGWRNIAISLIDAHAAPR
jgi:hypothetical protein